jgi:hypothetical protein
MSQVFQHAELLDHGVILEYQLPMTSRRLDCMICGQIEINKEIMEEEDGPVLTHGLHGLHQILMILPRTKNLYTDRERLEARYAEFRNN